MAALILIICSLLQEGEGMVMRRYGKKHSVGGVFFNSVICLFSTLFFLLTDKNGLVFPKELFIYGIICAFMIAGGFYFAYVALYTGSFVVTKVIGSFNGIFPILYGILFLKEPAKLTTYLGTTMIFTSLILMSAQTTSKNHGKKFSLRWLMFALAAAVSNGFISILSRMQQIRFDNSCDNEFMVIAFGGGAIILAVIGLLHEKDDISYILKYGTLYGLCTGMINGAKNLLNLFLYLLIPISVATPLRSGVSFVVSFLISVVIYKESFTKAQLLSIILGTFSIFMFMF